MTVSDSAPVEPSDAAGCCAQPDEAAPCRTQGSDTAPIDAAPCCGEPTGAAPRLGSRRTRQRDAIVDLLGRLDGFHSAQQLHWLLREQCEQIGLTTVYRTLQALADGGHIDVMSLPGGEQRYRRCSSGHHHHLVCRTCGATVEVHADEVERWAETVAAKHGFHEVSHTLEIFGTCQTCRATAG